MFYYQKRYILLAILLTIGFLAFQIYKNTTKKPNANTPSSISGSSVSGSATKTTEKATNQAIKIATSSNSNELSVMSLALKNDYVGDGDVTVIQDKNFDAKKADSLIQVKETITNTYAIYQIYNGNDFPIPSLSFSVNVVNNTNQSKTVIGGTFDYIPPKSSVYRFIDNKNKHYDLSQATYEYEGYYHNTFFNANSDLYINEIQFENKQLLIGIQDYSIDKSKMLQYEVFIYDENGNLITKEDNSQLLTSDSVIEDKSTTDVQQHFLPTYISFKEGYQCIIRYRSYYV